MNSVTKKVKTLFDLEASTIISLYKINLKEKGDYLFYAGENGYMKNIVFGGREYNYFPLIAEGFELHSDGRLPRPRLIMSNHQGTISLRLNFFDDFTNYKVTRIKTFVKYLDNINFPNNKNPYAEPDPDAAFVEDVYFINQKVREDDKVVEFELVSALELQNANVPSRAIYSNICVWRYRSTMGCGYVGKPIADDKNKRFMPTGYQGGMVGEETYFSSGEFMLPTNPPTVQEFAKTGENGAYPLWSSVTIYDKGDVVSLTPFDADAELTPVGIYVCLTNNTKSNPTYDIQHWRQDECDRTVDGCRLRFSDAATGAGGGKRYLSYGRSADAYWTEGEEGLPFGGFPGVDPYTYE